MRQFSSVWQDFIYLLFTPLGKSKDPALLTSNCSNFLVNLLFAAGSLRELEFLHNSLPSNLKLFKEDFKKLKEIWSEFFSNFNVKRENIGEDLKRAILDVIKPSKKTMFFRYYENYCKRNFPPINKISGDKLYLPSIKKRGNYEFVVCNMKIGEKYISQVSFYYQQKENKKGLLLLNFMADSRKLDLSLVCLLEKSPYIFVHDDPEINLIQIVYKIAIPHEKIEELISYGKRRYNENGYLAHPENFYPFIQEKLEKSFDQKVEFFRV